MHTKVFHATDAFDMPEWRTILERDPSRHIFATPEWNRVWWEQFGIGQRGMVVLFYDPDPVALAALTVDDTVEGRRLRFMGGDDLSDYLGPVIGGEEYRRPIGEAILTFLRDEFQDWDYFDAKCLPVPFGFSEWMVEAASRLGMLAGIKLSELTAVLALPDSFDAYKQRLTGKQRHELERKMRRFERELPGAELVTTDQAHLEEDLAAFVGLHRSSEGSKGEFMMPSRVSFFEHVARSFQLRGLLSLDSFRMEGKMVAATFSFRYDGAFYLYNSAYDSSLKPSSPGLILVARLIERSIAEGLRRFDFLRGRERYKYDLGAEALPLHSILIRRP
jgi:CelD/BcsL family acetyltransferase involved in cellulose biosynthesis